MKKEFFVVLFLFILTITGFGYGQIQPIAYKDSKSVKDDELTVGSTMPATTIRNVISFDSVLNIRALDNKLVIIDFWATWCGPCVTSLSKLQNLQYKFANDLQIVTVTQEKKTIVEKFLKLHKTGQTIISLPFVYEDTLLSKYFRYSIIPHEVWIYRGKVIAITSEQYVTEQNIKDVLDNKRIEWPVKYEIAGFDLASPLFYHRRNDNSVVRSLYYSGFTRYVNGPSTGMYYNIDSSTSTLRYNQFNLSILALYAIAYNNPAYADPKRCLLRVKDSSKYFYSGQYGYRDQWNQSNLYSYEAVLPMNYTDEQIRKKLNEDLGAFFNLTSSIETKKREVWILRPLPEVNTSIKSTELPTFEVRKDKKGSVVYSQRSLPIYHFVELFNQNTFASDLPLMIHEPGFPENIDLEFAITHPADINSWSEALRASGVQIVSAQKKMDYLLLSEK